MPQPDASTLPFSASTREIASALESVPAQFERLRDVCERRSTDIVLRLARSRDEHERAALHDASRAIDALEYALVTAHGAVTQAYRYATRATEATRRAAEAVPFETPASLASQRQPFRAAD